MAAWLEHEDGGGGVFAAASRNGERARSETGFETGSDAGFETGSDAGFETAPGREPDAEREGAHPPASWSEEDKALFASLHPSLQRTVARWEQERDALVRAREGEAGEARERHDRLLHWTRSTLDNALAQAQASIMADYAGIDMQALRRDNPALFLRVDAEIKSRQARLDAAMHAAREVTAYQAKEAEERRMASVRQELSGARERLAAVCGPDADVRAWKTQAETYLRDIGCPKEHLDGLSHAYQLELIAKAMRYDAMRAEAAGAEKKLAQAPRLMKAPGANGPPGWNGKRKSAWEALRANPKSAEAIAGLLDTLR